MTGYNITRQHCHRMQQHDPLEIFNEQANKGHAPHHKRCNNGGPEVQRRTINQYPESIEPDHERKTLGRRNAHLGRVRTNINGDNDQDKGEEEAHIQLAQEVAGISPYPPFGFEKEIPASEGWP